jgi:hypothetical protein
MVQQFRKSITALVLFLACCTVAAQGTQAPLTLKADAPDRYVVVPGDTLWGISQRYTDSPWRWPELWGMNKDQIRNPHLIYPGDVLVLDRAKGRLSVAGGAPGTVKLSPRARAESLARQEIPSIPPNIIEPFLTRPLVVEADGLDKAPSVVGTELNKVMLSAGSTGYARGTGNSKDDTWYLYRKGGALVDPDTNQTLGYEAIYLGTAQVTRPGEPSTFVVSTAVREIGTGDKLVSAGKPLAMNYAPHAPTKQIKGRVMGLYGGVSKTGEAGPHSIVTINRGKADGLEPGHVLALYSRGGTVRDASKARGAPDAEINLPDEHAGLVFVFRVFERVSYALVMNITRPVRALDVVQTP